MTDAGTPPDMTRPAALVRLGGLAAGLAVVALVSVRAGPDVASIRAFVEGTGWVAPAVYVITYAALTVALVPGAVLTAAGGLLFGITAGSLLTFLGATLGATIAFGVARLAGRRAVDRLVSGRVERVDRWLGARGFGAVLALRLVPLVPFSAANYAAGVTAVRLRDYVAGTAIGIIPGVVIYTVLGARASDPTDPVFIGAVAALVVLAVAGTVGMRRSRRRSRARHGHEPGEQPTTVGAHRE